MENERIKCVLLADRHHGLTEGVRGLLETTFGAVVMVADEASLLETAERLQPTLAVVDFSLARNDNLRCLRELRARCPDLKLIVVSVHDESSVRDAALQSGADGFVLKRAIATDLLPTVDAVLAGKPFDRGVRMKETARTDETQKKRGTL
jgi:two-component system secretion response regulator SsrB